MICEFMVAFPAYTHEMVLKMPWNTFYSMSWWYKASKMIAQKREQEKPVMKWPKRGK